MSSISLLIEKVLSGDIFDRTLGENAFNELKELIDLCVDVYAYAKCDYEITLMGNGVNAFECSSMADAVLDIVGEPENLNKLISDQAKTLRSAYGDDEDDEESEE